MVNFCAVCGCCTRTDIVREHLEDTLRICDVSAMGLFRESAASRNSRMPVYKHIIINFLCSSPDYFAEMAKIAKYEILQSLIVNLLAL